MASCPVMVERKTVSWGCALDAEHDGPHMAHEDARSVKERAEWMDAQAVLSATQGPPQTTAERYTEGAMDHPDQEKLEKTVGDLTLTKPDSLICPKCEDGHHFNCVQLNQLVAVLYHDQEDLEEWCSCFQDDPESHGMGEMVPKPTKQRSGDQPPPRLTGDVAVQTRIIEKARVLVERGDMNEEDFERIQRIMQESIRVGMQRYGTSLQTFNGRNTLQDLEDELRDSFVYISSINQAAQTSKDQVIGLCRDAVMVANQEGGTMDLDMVVEIVVNTIFGAVGTLSNLQGE